MAFSPAVLSYDDLRVRAEDFLDELHDERTLPVPIEEIDEFDFQIEVIPSEGILDDLDVDAFLTADLKRLYFDQFVMQNRRRRFRCSLAHELGHHELHRPLYMQSQINPIADWRTLQESISEDDYAWFEFRRTPLRGWFSCQRVNCFGPSKPASSRRGVRDDGPDALERDREDVSVQMARRPTRRLDPCD